MDRATLFVENVLEHASKYYDPVKAHEYYERTKQLKGRRRVGDLRGKKKKQAWEYVKYKVGEEKKATLETAKIKNKASVEQLRSTARQHREFLSEKIKALFDQISSDVDRQIDALPEGLSRTERSAKIKEIRGTAKTTKETSRAERDKEREDLSSALKGSLESARIAYKQTRESIKDRYEQKLDSEFEAIKKGEY